MAALDVKPVYRSRHGSVAFGSITVMSRHGKEQSYNINKNPEHRDRRSRRRTSSVATDTFLKSKKSASLPDGNLVTHMARHPSSGDTGVDDRKNRTRNARTIKAIDRRRELYKKFQVTAKMTIFCIREAKSHILRNKAYDEIGPYLNTLHFTDYEGQEDLLFDPTKFKADKQLRISEETKRILRKPWFDRTQKELYYAQVALRNIQAYAEYPVRMQRKIVEVGMYEKYDAKRVVIREGHPASAFYFLLSGSVVVLVYQGDTKVAKPVAYLKKGQTFGELAIIHRTKRQSTIVAKETIELLSLDVKDFHNIFMAGGVKNITDPDHNDFIQGLTLFHGWPIEKMAEEQDKCVFHYFKRGDVLVKDSNFSEWIFIVKSGSVSVMKKLRRVSPYQGQKQENCHLLSENTDFKNDKQKKGELELRNKQRRYVLPDINIPLRSLDNVDSTEPREHLRFHKSITVLEIGNTHKDYNNHHYTSSLSSQSGENLSSSLPLSETKLPVLGVLAKSRPKTSWEPWSQKHSNNAKNNFHSVSMDKLVSASRDSFKLYDILEEKAVSDKGSSESDTLSSRKNQKKLKSKKEKEEDEIVDKLHDKKNTIRTITHDLDAKFHQKDPDDFTVADLDPQFVHIQTLTKGQVFGESELVLGQQPSFCLVSNGAECIMVNKAFYLQYASEALLRELRHECSPYPSDDDMQIDLQVAVDWQAFRNNTFRHTINRLTKLKTVT